MTWFLRLFPTYRQMEADLQRARESDRKLLAEVLRLGDVAYQRRRALEQIADCETSGANATVRRMVRIARQSLDKASVDVSNEDDKVRILIVGGGGGGGGGGDGDGGGGGSFDVTPFTVEVGKVLERSIYAPPEGVSK